MKACPYFLDSKECHIYDFKAAGKNCDGLLSYINGQDNVCHHIGVEIEENDTNLLMVKEFVDSAIEQVKEAIAKTGTDISPGFKGVVGDNIRCTYRAYGKRYAYDWKNKPETFLTKKTYYNVDTDKVEAYLKEVGELPSGITEKDREKKLSIVLKEDK